MGETITKADLDRAVAEAVIEATAASQGRIAELEGRLDRLQLLLDDLAPAYPTDQVHYCLPACPADECSYVLLERWDGAKHVLEWLPLMPFECPAPEA